MSDIGSRLALIRAVLWTLLLALPAGGAVDFTVTGRFLYEDKAWDFDGWTGEDPVLPIRRADVFVMDAGTGRVLGRGATDDLGEFAVTCRTPSSAPVTIMARVDTDNRTWAKAVKAVPRVVVQSNAKVRYSAFTPPVAGHAPGGDLDLGTTTVPPIQVGIREGNPFNVFDMAVAALECVTGPRFASQRRVRSMRVHWPNVLGSYASGHRAWIATDDGYDDSVILHEMGHLVHNLYSDSDNPGGPHYFGDSDQDPRLAFGEGWATAFAGVVLADLGQRPLYVDSHGNAQRGGAQLQLDLETTEPYFDAARGAADEVAVACVLHDITDGGPLEGGDDDALQQGEAVGGMTPSQALWRVFVGPIKRARRLTMNDAWDGWLKLHAESPGYDALRDVYEGRRLRNWADAFEPDDTAALATTLESTALDVWSAEHTLYRGSESGLGPGRGDRDWFAVDLDEGDHVVFETRYPEGAFDATTQVDPFLALFDPSGRRVARDDDSGPGRNASIELVAPRSGTWRFCVRSRDRMHRYGRYDVRVRLVTP